METMNYSSQETINEVWPQIEALSYPLILNSAKKFKRLAYKEAGYKIELEDVVQEGRLALMNSLMKYDSSKEKAKNGFLRFASVVIKNAFINMFNKYKRNSENYKSSISYDEVAERLNFQENRFNNPEEFYIVKEQSIKVNEIIAFLLKNANKLHKKIWQQILSPTPKFIEFASKRSLSVKSPKAIAKFLNLKEFQVSFSKKKLKIAFTKLLNNKKFNYFSKNVVDIKQLPEVYISNGSYLNVDWVLKIAREQEFDLYSIRKTTEEKGDDYYRNIIYYDWGVVMAIKYKNESATLLLKGNFNPKSLNINSDSKFIKHINISWYSRLLRKIYGDING